MEVSIAGYHGMLGVILPFPLPVANQNRRQKGHKKHTHAEANDHELIHLTFSDT
jgi:hypothetical protein